MAQSTGLLGFLAKRWIAFERLRMARFGVRVDFAATSMRFTAKSITELTDGATGTLFPA